MCIVASTIRRFLDREDDGSDAGDGKSLVGEV